MVYAGGLVIMFSASVIPPVVAGSAVAAVASIVAAVLAFTSARRGSRVSLDLGLIHESQEWAQATLTSLRAENAELKAEVRALRIENADLKQEITTCRAQIADLRQALAVALDYDFGGDEE